MASQIASPQRSTQVSQRRNGPCRSPLLPEWQASDGLPCSAVPRTQETAREMKLPSCAHHVIVTAGEVEGGGAGSSRAAWVIVPRWGLSTPVSFRYAPRALHPHSWDAWRPRAHLLHQDSITCQTASVSLGAKTLSTLLLPLHTRLTPVQILKLC